MRKKRNIILLAAATLIIMGGCRESVDEDAIRKQIGEVLSTQVEAWNRGDITGFMAGYYRSDSLRFASGGSITYGWQTVLERYRKRYSGKAAMGTLGFSDIDVSVLDARAALVFGRWELQRSTDRPHGLFTLLFRRTPQGWKIVHDHSSSAE